MNNNVVPNSNNGQVEQPGIQPNINNTTVPVSSVSNPINTNVSQGANSGNVVSVNSVVNSIDSGLSQTVNNNTAVPMGGASSPTNFSQQVNSTPVVGSSQLQSQIQPQNTYGQNATQVNSQTNFPGNNGLNMPPMQEVVIDSNPPSKGKNALLIIFFIALLLMVWFLPEISSYIENLKVKRKQSMEVITTGLLKCELDRTSDNYDLLYQQNFSFVDSKLTKLSYEEVIKGDMNQDAEELDAMNLECKNLDTIAENLEGISVSCKLSGGTMIKKQTFNFSFLDPDSVTAAFTEAGAIYPNYENGQDIDTIEKNMKASGYSCERIK